MRSKLTGMLVVGAGFLACSCGNGDDGSQSTGGGGTLNGTGGVGATGAAFPTGGLPGTGGMMPTGGLPGTGGMMPTGGLPGTGGMVPTGGQMPTGGSMPAGGQMPTGGLSGSGGAVGGGGTGGVVGNTGGVVGDGGSNTGGSGPTGGSEPTGGTPPITGERPCDIYAADGVPCVAAYSMIRSLSSTYTGPLYQVRSGSSAQNTGSGGQLHDVGQTTDGFADKAAQDSVCGGTVCTVALLYDHSGHGNDLPVAKKGRDDGGPSGALDDFESIADAGPLTVGGHQVYSLYMDVRQGYRVPPPNTVGDGMPLHKEPQGIYMLADGTHSGTACCWDFGNVSPDPMRYGVMNTLFFGVAYWGRGEGTGPWFGADYEAGVWMGGTRDGDPGWGSLDGAHPPNPANPSLKVPFAIGYLKTDENNWALRMANAIADSTITTAYEGGLPKQMANEGGIVIGVGGDNSNNSWGTFFEGAIVAGWPSNEAEQAILENVKAAGYGQ